MRKIILSILITVLTAVSVGTPAFAAGKPKPTNMFVDAGHEYVSDGMRLEMGFQAGNGNTLIATSYQYEYNYNMRSKGFGVQYIELGTCPSQNMLKKTNIGSGWCTAGAYANNMCVIFLSTMNPHIKEEVGGANTEGPTEKIIPDVRGFYYSTDGGRTFAKGTSFPSYARVDGSHYRTIPGFMITDIQYHNGMWVATSDDLSSVSSTPYPMAFWSSDGVNWNIANTPTGINGIYDVNYINNVWTGWASNTQPLFSMDGKNWSTGTLDAPKLPQHWVDFNKTAQSYDLRDVNVPDYRDGQSEENYQLTRWSNNIEIYEGHVVEGNGKFYKVINEVVFDLYESTRVVDEVNPVIYSTDDGITWKRGKEISLPIVQSNYMLSGYDGSSLRFSGTLLNDKIQNVMHVDFVNGVWLIEANNLLYYSKDNCNTWNAYTSDYPVIPVTVKEGNTRKEIKWLVGTSSRSWRHETGYDFAIPMMFLKGSGSLLLSPDPIEYETDYSEPYSSKWLYYSEDGKSELVPDIGWNYHGRNTQNDIRHAWAPISLGDYFVRVDPAESGKMYVAKASGPHNWVRTSDNSSHWLECTCDECRKKPEGKTVRFLEPHKFMVEKDDTRHTLTCKSCNKVVAQNHQMETKYNEFEHWNVCPVCNYEGKHENHSWATRFDEYAHWSGCSGCGYMSGGREAHSLVQKKDKDYHWSECVGCGYVSKKEAHRWEWVSDGTNHWQVCAVCHEEKGNVSPHDSNLELHHDDAHHWKECPTCHKKKNIVEHKWFVKQNEVQHWNECKCGATLDCENHVMDTYGADASQHWEKCSVCGYEGGRSDHDLVRESNAAKHWLRCRVCDTTINEMPHTWELKADSAGHWYGCSACGMTTTREPHRFVTQNDGNGSWKVCAVCGEKKRLMISSSINEASGLVLGRHKYLTPDMVVTEYKIRTVEGKSVRCFPIKLTAVPTEGGYLTGYAKLSTGQVFPIFWEDTHTTISHAGGTGYCYIDSKQLNVSEKYGTLTVTVFEYANADLSEQICKDTRAVPIAIDVDGPITHIRIDRQNRNVSINSRDALSGVDLIQYAIEIAGNGNEALSYVPYTGEFTMPENGVQLHVKATDKIGNASVSSSVILDYNRPGGGGTEGGDGGGVAPPEHDFGPGNSHFRTALFDTYIIGGLR